ncbi:MAG TPA: alkaline phosphatase family protein [Vicinamibacterales bacterium]|nr:alkaline phosphatase family protein [Vicinamibacterales bacterium]
MTHLPQLSAVKTPRRAQPWTRIALILACGSLVLGPIAGCTREPATRARIVVLGIDGLDYDLTRELMDSGRLPNLAQLAQAGSIGPLQTTMPAQSPVAWSTFITGLQPGGHGIFDFVHRDPGTMQPFLSTTRTDEPRAMVSLGPWQLPLLGGRVQLLREGQPFWEATESHGVETTLIRMPANFPPSGTATRELSGMGTPDLLGSYGTFSFYTPLTDREVEMPGGRTYPVEIVDNVVTGTLVGPNNPFPRAPERLTTGFTAYLDPQLPVAKIVVGAEERVLREGDWSDWVPIEFELLPFQRLRGMGRFYVKQIRPAFELYVTPINLDPLDAAMPISTPAAWARQLAQATGRFYTQGMPEDTSALAAGIFSPDEFLAQARLAMEENVRQFRFALNGFDEGLLFHYFGTVDQVSHMMWRARDPAHPAYDAADAPYARVVEDLYVEIDALVGEALQTLPPDTLLIVMSDHGFTSWRRSFHLNAWLEQHGYLTLADPSRRNEDVFAAVDWSRTRAYGLGLNALYLNLRGRERDGIVPAEARDALLAEIQDRLHRTLDPATGEPVVASVYGREQAFGAVSRPELAPDLVLGYAKGTRASNESALGAVPAEVIVDNTGAWSGDHCMDPPSVPGVLITSRPLRQPASGLQDLAVAILAELDIADWRAPHQRSAGRPAARGLQ